jgi:uncharacterized protein (DUF305 family)
VRHTTVLTVALATFALTACGGDDADTTADASADATADASDAASGVDEDDVHFAQAMIAHHEQAIEMSEIALDPTVGAGPEVVALATAIRDAQDAEIDVMTGWLDAWGAPLAMDGDHDMSEAGMMTPEDMNDLAAAAGPEFDTAWLEMMLVHHRGAVSMAQDVQSDGADPAVRDLAGAIIAAQTAEIEQMEALLGP